jgi:FtsH-binding integral membrane protein
MGKTLAHVVAGVGVTAASTQVPALESLSPLLQLLLPLVVSFASLFLLMGMQAGALKYLVAILFTFTTGQLIRPLEERLKLRGVLQEVVWMTLGMFVAFAAIGFYDSQNLLGLGPYLLAGLLGLILAQVILLVIEVSYPSSKTNTKDTQHLVLKGVSIFAVALFSVFISYDIQLVKEDAALCSTNPDYVKEGLGLYLDILNLFTNLGGAAES